MMRLKILQEGHRPFQKLQLKIMKTVAGQIPGPVAILSYQRELFGKFFAACLQEAMRQCTEWSKGEVELLAAFISKQNKCLF
jgi:hypothetical protein